jgi:putative tricarboxylic transport membrane protein
MRRFGIPLSPAIIGVTLGPLAETQLRRALEPNLGDLSVLVTTPISISIYTILIILATTPAGPIVGQSGDAAGRNRYLDRNQRQQPTQSRPKRREDEAALEQAQYYLRRIVSVPGTAACSRFRERMPGLTR